MKRLSRGRKKPMADINIVPYIDVMLVLLVIFMTTTPLLSQGINVNLPQASAKPLTPEEQEPIIVSVNTQGEYYLNIASKPSEVIGAEQLKQSVGGALQTAQQKNQKREVYVKGDRAANYGKIVEAMVLLQTAGAENIGLLTEPVDH